MPGHGGFWLMERVRAKWPRTAIIMATPVDDLETVMKGQRAGAVDYVTKLFGRELQRQALTRANAALAAPDRAAQSFLFARSAIVWSKRPIPSILSCGVRRS